MISRIVLILTFHLVYAQEKNYTKQFDVERDNAIISKYFLCKHLHENPELSFKEKKSSKLLSINQLSLGFEIIDKIGVSGFAGVLENGYYLEINNLELT